MRSGEVGGPPQTVWSVEDTGADGQLDAPIPHAADIVREEVREVGARRDWREEDQVRRLLGVPGNRPGHPLAEQSVVQADVVAARRLPLDVGVDGGRSKRRNERIAELYLPSGIARLEGRVLLVIGERGVAGLRPRRPQLQVGERREVLHVRLLREPPAEGHRGEGTPLVAWTEFRGTVPTDAHRGEIAVADIVIEAPEEGDQLAFLDEQEV